MKKSSRGKTMDRSVYLRKRESGQSLIILALTFVAMLAFIGLVIDVGSLYVTYTQLKRAVDAAAVAAANNIKYPQASAEERKAKLTESARELLTLHNLTDVSTLSVYVCDDAGIPSDFDTICPDTMAGEMPRKLAWVQATQESPVYFLRLFGVESIPFTTSSVGEAATVDLVLVFDTSESMASDTDCSDDGVCTSGYDANNFDPAACNAADDCYPMRQAKDAAKGLIGNLFSGYDQVAVVQYDYDASVVYTLNSDMSAATAAISSIGVHNDASSQRTAWYSKTDPIYGNMHVINPIFPDDRDGDGSDVDPACTDEWIGKPGEGTPGRDLWDDITGAPCDDDYKLDTYDSDGDGDWSDENNSQASLNINISEHNFEGTSLLSTCIGCGIRVGMEQLKQGGRQSSLWVMIFLTDGLANLSDTNRTYDEIPSSFIYGFCGDDPSPINSFWSNLCIDLNTTCTAVDPLTGYCTNSYTDETRYCIDTDSDECPPDTTHTTTSRPYSVVDYARDMADAAALLESTNADEPLGEDIIVYTIALKAGVNGAPLLRYMANIGEDGSRGNDLCDGVPANQNCGNYFYAYQGAYLDQIFESIAGRIFTKISR